MEPEADAIARLKELQTHEWESAHANADRVLCDLLIKLGYQHVVDEWEKVGKWYA